MDLTGKLCEVSLDYITKKVMVKFLINEKPNGIEDLEYKDLKIKVTKATNPRSLDANSYFHVLCDKLRMKLGISMAHCKNILITSYGQMEYIDEGVPAAIKTNIPLEAMREMEVPHCKFVKMSEDGNYMYFLYRGSHTYDTSEMHKLLEGTIQECEMQGIETKTPDEIKRMEMLWEERKGYK